MNITIPLNERVLFEIVAEVVKALLPSVATAAQPSALPAQPSSPQRAQVAEEKKRKIREQTTKQALQKTGRPEVMICKRTNRAEPLNKTEVICQENAELKSKLGWLEAELQAVKSYLREVVQRGQARESQAGKCAWPPSAERAKPAEPKPKQAKQAEQSKADLINEERAERWLRENCTEWVDQICPFKLGNGRTWRELAENKGEKIPMNGKGAQPPRAYLHALEKWQSCKTWARLKAKVALEIGKNGTGSH